MTVKELIEKLLDCPMDAKITVLVELDRDYITGRLNEYPDYKYPIDDDADITDVNKFMNHYVQIELADPVEWSE